MRTIQHFLTFTALILLFSCKKDTNDPSGYVVGKNKFILKIDGDDREYYVHVPEGYKSNAATPVVFMLHGTSGDGEKFYNISGWKEVGETDNIITVFPSSWRYCIITQGQQETTTKWNSQPAEWTFCAGQTPRDDIKFFKSIITELKSKFNVDSKRIYLAGFSNGGQMASRCTVEMSDIFAAIVESASSLYGETNNLPTYTPKRKLPITFQVGNADYGPNNTGPAIPMNLLDTLISTPNLPYLNGKFYNTAQMNINSFGLNPNFNIVGDTNSYVVANYTSATSDPVNVFNFVMIKGLEHQYPNGINHPLIAARINWDWMKQFVLP